MPYSYFLERYAPGLLDRTINHLSVVFDHFELANAVYEVVDDAFQHGHWLSSYSGDSIRSLIAKELIAYEIPVPYAHVVIKDRVLFARNERHMLKEDFEQWVSNTILSAEQKRQLLGGQDVELSLETDKQYEYVRVYFRKTA